MFADTGFFIECDIEYPKSLHDLHGDYPLLAYRKNISDNDLSPSQKKLNLDPLQLHARGGAYKSTKLVLGLEDIEHHVIHSSLLDLYVR